MSDEAAALVCIGDAGDTHEGFIALGDGAGGPATYLWLRITGVLGGGGGVAPAVVLWLFLLWGNGDCSNRSLNAPHPSLLCTQKHRHG